MIILMWYLTASGVILNLKLLAVLADKSNLKAADAAWIMVCDSDNSQDALSKRDVIVKRLELFCVDGIPPLPICER